MTVKLVVLYGQPDDVAAFGSPEGQAASADYGQIAPPGSQMYVAEVTVST